MAQEEVDLSKGVQPCKYRAVFSKTDISDDLICCICQGLLTSTMELTCGHVFCEGCIMNWFEMKESCPMCKAEIDIEIDVNPSKCLDRMVSKVNVSCAYCDWKGENLDFKNHSNPEFRDCCQYLLTTCDSCDHKVRKKDMDTHVKDICEFRYVVCEFCKSDDVVYCELKDHYEECPKYEVKCECGSSFEKSDPHFDTCPEVLIDCSEKHNGCNERIKRKDLDQHLSNSLEKHYAYAEELINDLRIEINNLQTKLKNYEIPKDYQFKHGEMLRYRGEVYTFHERIDDSSIHIKHLVNNSNKFADINEVQLML